jgi:cytochrome P450
MTIQTAPKKPVADYTNPAQGLGEESSIWFKLTALARGDQQNPMRVLMSMIERYGPVIPVNLGNQRIIFISEPEYFKHVLVTKADNYVKYFDGLKPIFGKSMITNDGVLWQKIRMPQQPAFHPDMFAEYIPYFNAAIRSKMEIWARLAKTGESVEMVEQTWTLAADMVCKALFDREMPFNPHFVFKCVKVYTDVMNHKEIRLKKQAGELFEVLDQDAAKAVETWWSVPPAVIAADPREQRERTLLKMIEAAVADPNTPEFDQQQAIDELKQYLWAGTETTALTLAWALYLASVHPEAADRIRREGEQVCGDREPTAADYSALSYTRAVIQETMRIYPPIWGLIRVAAAADNIGGKEIRPGDRIALFAYGAHHNPRFWENPEEFRPERWMDGNARKQVKYSYLPFGAGKRSCIGGAMSQVENTLALSLLLRRFRPEYVGPVPAGINATVTLTPKGGLMFKIHELS